MNLYIHQYKQHIPSFNIEEVIKSFKAAFVFKPEKSRSLIDYHWWDKGRHLLRTWCHFTCSPYKRVRKKLCHQILVWSAKQTI